MGISNSVDLQSDSKVIFKELPIAKKMKLDYDQANRSHLTKVPGMSPDFKSTFQREYKGIKEFDRDHIKKTKELKSFLSSTTFSIGRKMSPGDD